MKKPLIALIMLVGFTAAYGVDDSQQVQSKISDAYKAWETAVERANRDYHRQVLEIKQDQKKQLEQDRERLAKAKRYDEVAAYSEKIGSIDGEIETAREAVRQGTKPGSKPKQAEAEPEAKGDAKVEDWYVGQWICDRIKGDTVPRHVLDDGTVRALRNNTAKITATSSTQVTLEFSDETTETWYRQSDGEILVFTFYKDKPVHAGVLRK